MKCLNCNNEGRGRSQYCSDTCKTVWNRNRKRNTEALIETVTEPESVTVTPEVVTLRPPNFGLSDCGCLHCQQSAGRLTLNHGPWKSASTLEPRGYNRVPLPGDVDYVGVYKGE